MDKINELIAFLQDCLDKPAILHFNFVRNRFPLPQSETKFFFFDSRVSYEIARIKNNPDWQEIFFDSVIDRLRNNVSDVITMRDFYRETFENQRKMYVKRVRACAQNARTYLGKNGSDSEKIKEVTETVIHFARGNYAYINKAEGDEELSGEFDQIFGLGEWQLLDNIYLEYEYYRIVHGLFIKALNQSCSIKSKDPFGNNEGAKPDYKSIKREGIFIEYWTLREEYGMSVEAAYKEIEKIILNEFGNKEKAKEVLNTTFELDSFSRLARNKKHLYLRNK